MSSHLTDTELRDFRTGSLGPEALLRADDHLAACEPCRRRAAAFANVDEAIVDATEQLGVDAEHLSDEDLQSLVTGQLTGRRAAAARAHLERCRTCAAQVNDLERWATPRRSTSRRWMPVAAAILLGVFIPAALWFASTREGNPDIIAGPAEQQRVRDALARGVATFPDFLSVPAHDVRMGPADRGQVFHVLSPVGTSTLTDRPTFEWERAPTATSYRVTVFDQQSNPVASSQPLTTTTWTPDESLPRGATYVWQVTAHLEGRDVIAPAAPAPAAVFHVLDRNAASTLERAEQEHPDAHLALGILNMEAGVRDRAARHLSQVPSTDPHAAVAARSLERLLSMGANPRSR